MELNFNNVQTIANHRFAKKTNKKNQPLCSKLAISCTLAIRLECIKKATSVIEAQQSVKWSQNILRIVAYFAVDKKLKNRNRMKTFTKTLMIMFAMFMCNCSDDSNEAVAQTTMPQKMYITIDGVSQSVTLYDNAATQALVAKLQEGPVTVTLNSSGGFEIWGALGFSLPTSNEQITAQPGDVILYNGSNICIMYGSNSWSYTRLGHIDALNESELRSFLKAGESKEVTIALDDKAFRYWNDRTGRFEIDGGDYEILIGASAADIRLSGTVSVKGTDAPVCEDLTKLPSYATGNIKAVSDEEFRELLGHEIPDGSWSGTIQANDAIAQLYYAKSLKARMVWKVMTNMLNKSLEKGEPDLNITFVYNMPIRAIGKMTGGMVSQEMCDGILDIVNGHAGGFFKGIGKIAGGFAKQKGVSKRQKELE